MFSKIKNSILLLVSLSILIIALLVSGVIPGLKLYSVLTGSMGPAIPEGSLVFVRPNQDYQVGDIITFITPVDGDKVLPPTTHRISQTVEVGDDRVDFITKGDANKAEDTYTISKSKIIGKVELSVPALGTAVDFVKTPVGAIFVVILPAAFVIFSEINNIRSNISINRKGGKSTENSKENEVGNED